jgi:2-dehydro-3-deoxyphosphooctonate aldolase (KDO 8-P synthase)
MIPEFIPRLHHLNSGNFFLIAGPCVVENEKMPLEIAEKIMAITEKLKIPFIFKASYKKANRSSIDSFSGIGDIKALKAIQKVGEKLSIPTLTDIHSEEEAIKAALYVDILQIPAFLCRQTELLLAAGKTERVINIKKGQFSSAANMKFAVDKIKYTGNEKVMLTERGTTFGYNDLVVDFRNVPEMQKFQVPVVVDITHSLQQPNQSSGVTGGRPDMIETLGKAAIASGSDGIFLETHPNPAIAKSDGANMLRLDMLEDLLTKLVRIRKAL